jgi:uncharacterized membrane protein
MRLMCSFLFLVFSACGGHGHGSEGEPSGAACPQGSALTYTNFGQNFMATYCVSCHDSAKTGNARNGAPAFHDFDTLDGIKAVANHVDEYTAAGPSSVNEIMPEGDGPVPTLAEREMLGEWLACGAP